MFKEEGRILADPWLHRQAAKILYQKLTFVHLHPCFVFIGDYLFKVGQ
jgi:hypothetical protein